MLGSREPQKKELLAWLKAVKDNAKTGTTTEAASFGEIVFLAVAWHAAEDVLQQIRPQLAGKVVIDVTNPIVFSDDQPPTLSFGHNMSGGEVVQQGLPDSHVVKTLNFVNFTHMADPNYGQGTPVMFMCGNNDSAKSQTQDILEELGWNDICDIGDISKSRLLEPLCLLWIEYGITRDTWDHAFAVLDQ